MTLTSLSNLPAPESPVTLPAAAREISAWQRSVDRGFRIDCEQGRRYMVGCGLNPSTEVVQEITQHLLADLNNKPGRPNSLAQFKALLKPEDEQWFHLTVEQKLDSIVRHIPHRAILEDAALDFMLLTQCLKSGHVPSQQALEETFNSLVDSCVELSQLYREAQALGYSIPIEGSALDVRLRLVECFVISFGLDVHPRVLGAVVIENKDIGLFRKICEITGRGELANGTFSLRPDEDGKGEILTTSQELENSEVSPRPLSEVIAGLAKETDCDALRVLASSTPEKFHLSPELTIRLYQEICSRQDFGARSLGSATVLFCKCAQFLPVPSSEIAPLIQQGINRYLAIKPERLRGGSEVVADMRLPQFERLVGLPNDLSDAAFQKQRFLTAAEGGNGSLVRPPKLTPEEALLYHLEHAHTSQDLRFILGQFNAICKYDSRPFALPIGALIEAGKRARMGSAALLAVVTELGFALPPSHAHRAYQEALRSCDTAQELFGWLGAIEERSGIALDSDTLKAGLSSQGAPADYLSSRIRDISIGTLGTAVSDSVALIQRLERIIGEPLHIPPDYVQPAFAQTLGIELNRDLSFQARERLWRACEANTEFLKQVTGQEPTKELKHSCFTYLMAAGGVRRADMERYSSLVGLTLEPETVTRSYATLAMCLARGGNMSEIEEAIDGLEAFTGIPFSVTPTQLDVLKLLAESRGDDYPARIALICNRAGCSAELHVTDIVLNDPRFYARLHTPISDDVLDGFFSNPKNISAPCFARMLTVFDCYGYAHRRLERLSGRTDANTRHEEVAILTAIAGMGGREDPQTQSAIDRLWELAQLRDPTLSNELGAAFSVIIGKGDLSLLRKVIGGVRALDDLSVLVLHAALKSKSEGAAKVFWSAFKMGLDNDYDYAGDVLKIILNFLEPPFIPAVHRKELRSFIEHAETIDFRAFALYEVIYDINSRAVSESAAALLTTAIISPGGRTDSVSSIQAMNPRIPADTFVQIATLMDWNPALLAKWNEHYGACKGREAEEGLLFAVTQACTLPPWGESRIAEFYRTSGPVA